MTIRIPDELRAFAENAARLAGYPSVDDYVCALIQGAKKGNGKEEQSRPAATTNFHTTSTSLDTLLKAQGVRPVNRFEDLLGDFWPEDETADDFLAEVNVWQNEGR